MLSLKTVGSQKIAIDTVKCESIKGLGKAELKLKKLNLIVGANNTGKSTFLDILYNSCRYINTQKMHSFVSTLGNNYKVEIVFRTSDPPNDFTLVLPEYQKSMQDADLVSNSKKINNINYIQSCITFLKAECENFFENDVEDFLKVNVGLYPRQALGYIKKKSPEKYTKLLDFLNNRFKIEIKFEGAFGAPSKIFFREEGEEEFIEIDNIGMGTKKILVILLSSLLSPNFLLIDEPENSLHPNYINLLLDFIVNNTDSQIIFCTHSMLLTNYLMRNYKENANFFLFRKEIKDNTNRAKSLSLEKILKQEGEALSIYTELGINLSDLFFYNGIIFVEGKDDVIFYDSIFRNTVDDWDARNIEIQFLEGSKNVEKQSEKDHIQASIASPVIYPVPFFHIMDKDFRINPKNKSNLIYLKRHSIENYLCDLEFLRFVLNDSNLNNVWYYESLRDKLINQTIFRYLYSNLGMSYLFANAKDLNRFGENFMDALFKINSSTQKSLQDIISDLRNDVLKQEDLYKHHIDKLFEQSCKRFSNKTCDNYDELIKHIENTVHEIEKEPKNILVYARGHDVENEMFKLIPHDRPSEKSNPNRLTYLSSYSKFLINELNDKHIIKEEFNEITRYVLDYFKSQ